MALYVDGQKIYNSLVVDGEVGGETPSKLTKLINWTLFSHPSAFDSIPLPANYTDYTHLLIVCRQETGIPTWIEPMLEDAFDYYLDNSSIPDNVFLLIDTNNITASDQYIYIPFLNGAAFTFGTWGTTVINSSRILGTNYNWGWQNIYLVCYGVNINS